MRVFRTYLLFCALIASLGENAAGEIFHHKDGLLRDAGFSQDDKSFDYRLPTSVTPISYEIMLMPKLQDDFRFEGTVKINATVKQDTDTITLNVGDITINTQSVLSNMTNLVKSSDHNKVTEKHTITLSEILNKGSEILITLDFKGKLRDDMIGFYRSSYFDKDGIKWLAATQFQATHARHAFPCFDEPSFKAFFTIRILRNKSHTCLSNMPLAESKEEGDMIWDTFQETTVPMSTYLVAFVISEFQHHERDQFKVWARPTVVDQAVYALEIGTNALELLGETFGQSYHLPKMDMVAVPDFSAGAMENWGLVTYREVQMLYDQKEASASAQQTVASAVAHELTHMWFGNLVTPKWWGYLWLSEGFANYFQYFATADIEKSWNMREQFVVDEHQTALIADSLESSQPMTREVTSQTQIEGMGDTITYSKGASIVRMMGFIFGNDVFKFALRDYLNKNKETGLGHPDALWEVLQARAKFEDSKQLSVKTIMETWTTQAGYPVVSVSINDKGELNVTQERLFLRNLDKTSTDVKWWVPLTWTTQSKSNFDDTTIKHWLSSKEDTVNFQVNPKEWVIFNVQSSGFYRVNYNRNGWQRITDVLHSDKFTDIHVLNRAALVDDLLNLGRAGYQNYDTVLDGITYLKRETNYLPFRAALNGLSYLNKRFREYEEHSLLKQYVLSLIDGRRKELGYEDRPDDDRLTVLLRRDLNIWACNFDDEECVTTYVNKFQKWKEDHLLIKPNERTAAYCVGIRNGTSDDWEFLWKRYSYFDNAAKQIEIINALGCSLNTTILEKYLKYAISDYQTSRIRKQDSMSVFGAVYSSMIGAEYTLDFVDKYYKDMEKYYGGLSEVATILDGASQRFSTHRLVDKFQDFVNRHKTEFEPILKSLETSLQVARYELEWYNTSSEPVIRWLREYNDGDPVTEPTTSTPTTSTPTTSTPTTSTPPDEEDAKYLLPITVVPNKYIISLMPYLKREIFTFDGNVLISVKVVKQTEKIVLHSAELKHRSVMVKNDQDENILKDYRVENKYDFLEIELKQKVDPGSQLTIEIAYNGNITSDLRGFYRSSYINNNGSTSWLAATQLEPVFARRLFPCFDEPKLKATFTVQVCPEIGFNVISNMDLKKIQINVNGCPSKLFVFSESVKMSTYLVAVLVSDFQSTKMVENKYAVYARPNAVDQAEYALSAISKLVKFFETKLDMEYPIEKLDMVALPDFEMNAMENWGLLTYRETSLLYDENHSSITSKQAIRNVIAHEIAHQWFGNLVTPKWWKYLWLSEGFGRYFQYHATAIAFNDTTLESQFVVDHVHSAFATDSLSSHPMTDDVYTPDQIQGMFDTISYAKAASVLRMVEKTFGRKLFYNALRDYLEEGKYNVITPDNLYGELQKEITLAGRKENIQEILDTWTTQSGYPVVHVDIKYKTINLTQERFLLKGRQDSFDDNIWRIPITIASMNHLDYENTTPSHWLTEKTMTIESPDDSPFPAELIFNVQQSGFYRVNYNDNTWRALTTILSTWKFNIIHEINRAALIDDLMNLARANYVSYDIVLTATQYLTKERNYLPWRAFYNNLPYLNRRFSGRDMESLYKKYLTSLIKPLYEELTFMDDNDKDDLIRMRNMLRLYTREWACKLDIADCKFHAVRYFQQKRYNSQVIPPNYRGVVYCMALKMDGTEFTYNFLWKEYKESNVMANKLVILNSMACSQNMNILKKLLLAAIKEDSLIRLQDSTKVFSNVYDAGLIGVEAVMNVIMDEANYDSMKKRFGGYKEIRDIVGALASRLSTYELYEKYRELLDWLVKKEPAFEEFVDSFLADAEYEFDWYEREVPEIFEALDSMMSDYAYRLPNTLYPELYNIFLTPHIEEGTFEGKVQIYIRVKTNTSSVVLNSHKLDIKKVSVYRIKTSTEENDDSKIEISVLKRVMNDTAQLMILYLTEFINEENMMVDIEYNGILNDNMQGFYRSSYFDKSGKLRWLATTQFEPVHARQAFPCFDEPAFKSKFKINIHRPSSDNVITLSNMPRLESIVSEKDGYQWDIFENTTVNMPTYLVAFIVSEFEPLGKPADKIKIWGRPEVVEAGDLAQDFAVTHLRTLENLTEIEYPLPKVDLVGIPDFEMGAMENWGLMTFREYGLFYKENVITSKYEKYLITIIAHEFAHTWFGNLVTCQWWDYIWLNEGFAEYLEWYVADQMFPEYKFMDQFVVYELQAALAQDALDSAHPMTNPVKTPEEIKGIFDYVTYGKSACILRMFFNAFDKEVPKLALRDYLKEHQGGTVRPTDLWNSFEKYGSISSGIKEMIIEEVMSTWTDQAGYPVVHAIFNGSVLTLSQERFFLNNNTKKIKQNTEFYWIPIHIRTAIEHYNFATLDTKLWLGREAERVYINPINEWVIVNYNQIGFYRVNYDENTWLRLIEELQSPGFENIHVLNRAQIMDDLFYLARGSYVKDNFWWTATKYILQEKEHLPWKAFLNSLDYVYERFEGKINENNLKKYVLILMNKTYEQVGFDDLDDDQLMDRFHREMILQWACKLGNPDCIKRSVELFASLRNGSLNSIPANAQAAIYCTAIQNGTSDDWNFLWNKYLESNFASEKLVILNALGCSTDPEVLYAYLKRVIVIDVNDVVIRKQDAPTVFASVYGASQLGINVTLDFLRNNLNELHDYFGNWDGVRKLAANAGSHISDAAIYSKLSYIYGSYPNIFLPKLVQPVIDTVADNFEWYRIHGEPFGYWILEELDNNTVAPGGSTTTEPMNIVIILMSLFAIISYYCDCW